MERFSVDRIENDFAVCENDKGEFVNIKVSKLPSDIKEGTILIKTERDTYIIDTDQELKRKKYLYDLQNKLNEPLK